MRRRRLARRINGYSLIGFLVLFVLLAIRPSQEVAATAHIGGLVAAFAAHFLAALYMAFARCPRCGQPFAERNLLWWLTSLEDQLTKTCRSCGLSLDTK